VALERLLFVLVAVAGVPACGGGTSSSHASCSSPGRCPKDAPRTPVELADCEATLADPCGGKYQALLDCGAGLEKCAADGTEDLHATFAATSSTCAGLGKAWLACQELVPVDAGGGG
jgi:hypothetical protein